MFTAPTALPDDPAMLQHILRAALAEIERLRLMIADNATGPWGFIDATDFRLAGDNCVAV